MCSQALPGHQFNTNKLIIKVVYKMYGLYKFEGGVMWEYTDKVKEHFLNPRNVGEIENPDGVAEVGSLACGDALKLTFKLDEN